MSQLVKWAVEKLGIPSRKKKPTVPTVQRDARGATPGRSAWQPGNVRLPVLPSASPRLISILPASQARGSRERSSHRLTVNFRSDVQVEEIEERGSSLQHVRSSRNNSSMSNISLFYGSRSSSRNSRRSGSTPRQNARVDRIWLDPEFDVNAEESETPGRADGGFLGGIREVSFELPNLVPEAPRQPKRSGSSGRKSSGVRSKSANRPLPVRVAPIELRGPVSCDSEKTPRAPKVNHAAGLVPFLPEENSEKSQKSSQSVAAPSFLRPR